MNHLYVSTGCGVSVMLNTKEHACVEIVRAVCGAGKTYNYSNYINATPADKFIVAAKTEILCEQIQRGLKDSVLISTEGLNLRKKKVQKSVTGEIVECVKSYRHRVIVCSQRALELLALRLHYDDALRLALIDYQILIDEAPDNRKQINVTVDMGLKSQYPWLAYTTVIDGLMYATQVEQLRLALKANDTKSAGLIVALINGDKVRAVRLPDNKLMLKCSARSDLYLAAKVCNGKKNVVIGSLIDQSPFIKTGIRNGHIIEALPSNKIVISDSRNKHHNTGRVNIGVLTDKKASKTRSAKYVHEIAQRAVSELVTIGKPFIWASNSNGIECEFETIFESYFAPIGGVQVPYSSEGLNDYQDYTVAVWLGCVNMADKDKADYGSPEDVADWERWNTLEKCYQSLARTAIRKQDNHAIVQPVHFLVLDDAQASYLTENYFTEAVRMGFEPVQIETVDWSQANAQREFVKGDKTRAAIFEAANAVKASGVKKVTAKAVCEWLKGDVSQPTVSRHLKAWKQEQA